MHEEYLSNRYKVKENQKYYPGQIGASIGEKGLQVFLRFEDGVVVPFYHHEIEIIEVGESNV